VSMRRVVPVLRSILRRMAVAAAFIVPASATGGPAPVEIRCTSAWILGEPAAMQLVVDATVDSVWIEPASSPGTHGRRMLRARVHEVVAGTWVRDRVVFQDALGSVGVEGVRNHFVLIWYRGRGVDRFEDRGVWQAQVLPGLRVDGRGLVLDLHARPGSVDPVPGGGPREPCLVLREDEYPRWREWIRAELRTPSVEAARSNTVLVGTVDDPVTRSGTGPVSVSLRVERVVVGHASEFEAVLTPDPALARERWRFTALTAPRLRPGWRGVFFLDRQGDTLTLVDGRHLFALDEHDGVSITGESLEAFLWRLAG